jgi:hypothetical protein
MKKILTVIFLTVSLTCHGQIKFKSYLETGYEKKYIDITNDCIYRSNSFFGQLYISGIYKNLSLYVSDKTYFNPYNITTYIPTQIEYYIGTKYSFKIIDFSFEHLCSHGVSNDMFFESHNRFSIRVNILK